jgi:serine/threonine protein kinase
MELLLPVPGVAPLFGIDWVDAEGSMRAGVLRQGSGYIHSNAPTRAIAHPPLIALIEACPAGVRSHEFPLPMSIPTAARFALQVAFSLEIAHAHGTGIGGIRPEHIFISDAHDTPAVSGIAPRAERFWQMLPRPDFGIAPAYRDTYDAPEQWSIQDDGKPAPGGDIFSLCATLSFWLCGRHPFRGETPDAQISAMRAGDHIAWPADAIDILRHPLILRGLDPDPMVRPSIADALNVLRRFAPDVRPDWEGYVA